MELVPHLWQAFETGPIDVVVEFHKTLTIDDAGGRKELAAACEATVREGVIRALSGKYPARATQRRRKRAKAAARVGSATGKPA
jgi:1-acyl-sn-glycerol-3-phosphate acyltransferase